MVSPTPSTIFTRDILGNYVCNSFAEAAGSGPFDVIIIGGGTFGLALAQNLFFRSKRFTGSVPEDTFKPPNFRILVLEAGPFALPAHVQDLPNLRLFAPGAAVPNPPTRATPLPSTRARLIAAGLDGGPLLENWGLPWNSTEPFGGMAYCLGGRSLYFGGWSPRYLTTEMPTAPIGTVTAQTLWPTIVVDDLQVRFFAEAAAATGTNTSNDFLSGPLQSHFRQVLYNGYGAIPNAIPIADIQNVSVVGPRVQLEAAASPNPAAFTDSLKLDAPLAVQIQAQPGFFPFNKFSSVPPGITAAREAFAEAGTDNVRKRLMIVPNCHVTRLRTRDYTLATGAIVKEITGVETNLSSTPLDLTGPIDGSVNRRPIVVLALGAIESARMARDSLGGGTPSLREIGSNLMVHVRKNVPFTVAIPANVNLIGTDVGAFIVRCRSNINGTPVHYHFQITVSAIPAGANAGAAEANLFQNVPDLDNVERLAQIPPARLGVVIRAVGEMLPPLGRNTVTLDMIDLDFGAPRANVAIQRGPEDGQLQQEMDLVIQHLAQQVFGAPAPVAIPPADALGTTFHESGTLRMGNDPAASVVNPYGLFHNVDNLYAGDASVLPTCGSANPVMNGIAVQRRLAKQLVPEGDGVGNPGSGRVVRPHATPQMPAAAPPAGTVLNLFNGQTIANWRMVGRGSFHLIDGALQSVPSFDLGLLWCTIPMPQDYRLELEFFIRLQETNSGICVRFPDPENSGFYNPAWAPVSSGFEIQIDNTGAPDQASKHKTGAVYNVNYPGDPNPTPGVPPATAGDFVTPINALIGGWNQYRIDVRGDQFEVSLNGTPTVRYTNPDSNRGRFSNAVPTFVGLQSYSNYSYTAAFRAITATVL